MLDAWMPPTDWYDEWWEPTLLLSKVVEHNRGVPEEELFNRPQLKPLQEAYAAALFSSISTRTKARAVRLVSAEFPDFEILFGEEIRQFEITEADVRGRRRGDEYRLAARRKAGGQPSVFERFDPTTEEAMAYDAIAHAIRLKAKKFYNPMPHLLVYVNFDLYRELPLTRNRADELTHELRRNFVSICLLWGANAIRLCPNPANVVADARIIELIAR